MKILAIIPEHGGSLDMPRKNMREMVGKPLIAWTLEQAQASQLVTHVVVSSADDETVSVSEAQGCEVVRRPDEISEAEATAESVSSHALDALRVRDRYRPDLQVFLRCTSSIRDPGNIDFAKGKLIEEAGDSLLAVVPTQNSF